MRDPLPTSSRITNAVVFLALGIPVTTLAISWIRVGPGYEISSLIAPLAVADAIVWGGAGMLARADCSQARRSGRQLMLTRNALLVGAAVMSIVMLAGGLALARHVLGAQGSSTDAVAIFTIPAFAIVGGLFGYGLTWLGGVALQWFSRRRSGQRAA